jgi:hypothetical protein
MKFNTLLICLLTGFISSFILSTTATAGDFNVPEGTEIRIKVIEPLSSETAIEGNIFEVEVANDVVISGQTVILAGSRGQGEVVSVRKKTFIGNAGDIDVKIKFVNVGDKSVPLRAQRVKPEDDKHGVSGIIATLVDTMSYFKMGNDKVIKPGQIVLAYVDEEVTVPFPPPNVFKSE